MTETATASVADELAVAREHLDELEEQRKQEIVAEEEAARAVALERASKEMRSTVDAYRKTRAELLPCLTALADLADELVTYRQTMRRCSWRASKLDGDVGVVPPRLLGQDTKVRHVLDKARRALTAVGGV